ncbi:MAG: hypothetical protein F4Z86_07660 [Gemmatimonadetes bacterium]|nr:hypothetical protein [Gemmatimonadota bacterium]MYB58861.1 hypothetical protein [Gemmatimonadota bacterium]
MSIWWSKGCGTQNGRGKSMDSVKINDFTNAKDQARERLALLQQTCQQYAEFLPVETRDVQEKMARVRIRLEQEVFEVAFFGAFSDGKSTIIAALTKSLDTPIAVEPTTDKVERYSYGDWIFVDTPGTFSNKLLHDDVTQSYISEADLVVFVVNAVNPLPKSQEDLVRWLLMDLGKEPHVIFAINRMDEVADLEDKTDFEHHGKVKQRTLLKTLNDICGKSFSPTVVTISADPYEMGIEEWLDNPEEYEHLSRLQSLIGAIEEHLSRAAEQIQANAGMASVRDGIDMILERLEDLNKDLQNAHDMLAQRATELAQERDRLEQLVSQAHLGIREDVESMRRDLLDGLDACVDQRALKNLIDRDIGEDGKHLKRRVNIIVERWGQTLRGQAKPIFDRVTASMEENDSLLGDLLKRGGPALGKVLQKVFGGNARQIADGILRIRNILNIPIKFKPWGAMKLAKNLKAIVWLAPLLEGLPTAFDMIRERKLASAVAELKESIDQGLEEFFETFTRDEFEQQACPELIEIRQMAKEQETKFRDVKKMLRASGDAVIEFRDLRRNEWG